MGMDLSYQGLPPGCGFVELVREVAEKDLGEATYAQFISGWLRRGDLRRGGVLHPAPGREGDYEDTAGKAFWDWCCMAVGRFPGIADRYLDLLRRWNGVHFMLSAKNRKSSRWPRPAPTDPRSWNDPVGAFDEVIGLAFYDAPPIAPGVVAVQGLPIRLIPATVVADIGPCVGALQFEEVASHLDEFLTLKHRTLFLTPAERSHKEWEFNVFRTLFEDFKNFFVIAADQGESVMVVYD
jgi:hypothetical protein